jgi:hypothetical protein
MFADTYLNERKDIPNTLPVGLATARTRLDVSLARCALGWNMGKNAPQIPFPLQDGRLKVSQGGGTLQIS